MIKKYIKIKLTSKIEKRTFDRVWNTQDQKIIKLENCMPISTTESEYFIRFTNLFYVVRGNCYTAKSEV